jgi:CHAT domain-containing protein
MSEAKLVEELLALPTSEDQRTFLRAHQADLNEDSAVALKTQADHYLRTNIQQSVRTAELLILMGDEFGNPLYRALGLLAKANGLTIGLGEHQPAIPLYDEAAKIYAEYERPVQQATSQIGKLWALASLGLYEDAIRTGLWAAGILEGEEEWFLLAKLTVNTGIIYGRNGDDRLALKQFDRARELYRICEAEDEYIAGVEYDRAIVLRNLGHFDASIEASQTALGMLTGTDLMIDYARAQQSLAVTYFTLGRYTEALTLLAEAKEIFLEDERDRDALLADLFISDCLLELRRFNDVLPICDQATVVFADLGAYLEVAQARLNAAVAYAGLGQYAKAHQELAAARKIFDHEKNEYWAALTDIEMSAILIREDRFEESLAAAQRAEEIFHSQDVPHKEALASLAAGNAFFNLTQYDQAEEQVESALRSVEQLDLSFITFQGFYLSGKIAQSRGEIEKAQDCYDQAMLALERLRGRLMVEYRMGFIEDKQRIYEDAVQLCLHTGQSAKGLEYAERAKSRALLELLTFQLNLSIQPRTLQDLHLVEELLHLREVRDQKYRRWLGGEKVWEESLEALEENRRRVWGDVQELEKRITDLWHQLLIRDADYARDAALWQVRTEPVQPYLPEDGLLIEYFVAVGELVVFTVTREGVSATRLNANLKKVMERFRLMGLNLQLARVSSPDQVASLVDSPRVVLQELFDLLIRPLEEEIKAYQKLTIVPHGPLHYLPFHALFDGQQYLIENYEINYLPAASILRYCSEVQPAPSNVLALGNSENGQLPYAVLEADEVVKVLGGKALLEKNASLENFKSQAADYRAIHLATHGDFRADNPLFSSLTLADGWLTTLDIFNLKLNASLVTLSACQTGRNLVSGGDELLGLMRAFIYAGAASLVLSQWAVDDQSTARLMTNFYEGLAGGLSKSAALQHAQRRMILGETLGGKRDTHPYFWAPFYLIGDAGPL